MFIRTSIIVTLICCLTAIVLAQPGIWAPEINLSNTDHGSGTQNIVIGNDGIIHVAWRDNSRLGGGVDERDILYCQYDGQFWSSPVQISAYEVTASTNPRIAVDSQGIPHIVWSQYVYTSPDIYYSFLTDTGWIEPINLSDNLMPSQDVDIVIDSQDQIHLVWSDGYYGSMDLFYRCFDGFEWLPIDTVFQGSYSYADNRIAIDSQDRIHLTWMDFGNFGAMCEIGYSMFDGISWSEPVNISSWPEEWSQDPDIDVDSDDHPHIVWDQLTPIWPIEEIYYSSFDGAIWSAPAPITATAMECGYPTLAITNTGVKHLLFMIADQFGNEYVNYSYCQDGIWSEPDTVIVGPTSIGSDLTIGPGNVVHAVINPMIWFGNCDIYYTYNTSGTVSLLADLIPESSSITIPAYGGTFTYDVLLENVQVVPLTFDLWIDAKLPSGQPYGPILLRPDVTLPPGNSIQRFDLSQSIPGGAPAGDYWYRIYLGSNYNNAVVAADSFAFSKSGATLSDDEWTLSGWDQDLVQPNVSVIKTDVQSISCETYPNPFNSETTLRFFLPESNQVTLSLFDVTGKKVNSLLDQFLHAGNHQVVLNGKFLSSGIYFYELNVNDHSFRGKVSLIK